MKWLILALCFAFFACSDPLSNYNKVEDARTTAAYKLGAADVGLEHALAALNEPEHYVTAEVLQERAIAKRKQDCPWPWTEIEDNKNQSEEK